MIKSQSAYAPRTHVPILYRGSGGVKRSIAFLFMPFNARGFFTAKYTHAKVHSTKRTASMACFGCGQWKCIFSTPHLLLAALLSCRRWTWAISSTRLSKRNPSDWIYEEKGYPESCKDTLYA